MSSYITKEGLVKLTEAFFFQILYFGYFKIREIYTPFYREKDKSAKFLVPFSFDFNKNKKGD